MLTDEKRQAHVLSGAYGNSRQVIYHHNYDVFLLGRLALRRFSGTPASSISLENLKKEFSLDQVQTYAENVTKIRRTIELNFVSLAFYLFIISSLRIEVRVFVSLKKICEKINFIKWPEDAHPDPRITFHNRLSFD